MSDRYATLSVGAWSLRRELGHLLDGEVVHVSRGKPRTYSAVVDWSDSRGATARLVARLTGRPFYGVSIGPLASVRPERDPPMSLTLARPDAPARPETGDAAEGLALLRRLRLAWRNDGRDRYRRREPANLVIARPRRDDTVELLRTASEGGLRTLLISDSRQSPTASVELAQAVSNVQAVAGINPWALFDVAARVYEAGSELGTLARLAGCAVEGASGTSDVDLFRARFLDSPVYFDAWSRAPTSFAEAAEQLAWLRDRFLGNDRRSYCVGVSGWKARRIARFLESPDGPAVFGSSPTTTVEAAARNRGQVVTWETRMPGRLAADCAAAGVPLLRMEDGFLRSVGLGATFLPGASAVLDGRGIYYDPSGPSDLEHVLQTTDFPPELVARAAALRESVVALRLSKYNVGRPAKLDKPADGRSTVLVPGQVEDDASIQLGTRTTRTNLALLESARRRNPDAFIIFKPHPDVAAGLRRGAIAEADARRHADRLVTDVAITDLLDGVDRVETMTSLAGFEALMRGVDVCVHGRPFYAGWGLTEDLDPIPRRTRRLTLDELVAGALILYPRYLDPATGLRCSPEVLAMHLAASRQVATSPTLSALRMAYVRARHGLLGPIGTLLRRAREASPQRDNAG